MSSFQQNLWKMQRNNEAWFIHKKIEAINKNCSEEAQILYLLDWDFKSIVLSMLKSWRKTYAKNQRKQ